jgi:fimbrial chaperone protein
VATLISYSSEVVMFKRLVTALAVLALFPAFGFAGTFAVNPVRIDLAPERPNNSLQISNQGPDPALVQAHVVLWSLVNNEEIESPTQDVVVNPPIFRIGPAAKQVIRVGSRSPNRSHNELSYRLILEEVPPRISTVPGLRTVLRISIPLFIAPVNQTSPVMVWTAQKTAPGVLTITGRNNGTRHLQVKQLQLVPSRVPEAVATVSRLQYLLPGESRQWQMNVAEADTSGPVRIIAKTDAGDVNVVLSIQN